MAPAKRMAADLVNGDPHHNRVRQKSIRERFGLGMAAPERARAASKTAQIWGLFQTRVGYRYTPKKKAPAKGIARDMVAEYMATF